MISGLPTELHDKIFEYLLPKNLPIFIEAESLCIPIVGRDLRVLMLVSRTINKSATDVFWTNTIVHVNLVHEDASSDRHKQTRLDAFGLAWNPTMKRRTLTRLRSDERTAFKNILRNVKTVKLEITSRSLEYCVRRLDTTSVGDGDFKEYACYFLDALEDSTRFQRLIVDISSDTTYMARLYSKKDTKRVKWHLELFTNLYGIQLEIRFVWMGSVLEVKEPNLKDHIDQLCRSASTANVSPEKEKRVPKK
jgi:hypothetical protein